MGLTERWILIQWVMVSPIMVKHPGNRSVSGGIRDLAGMVDGLYSLPAVAGL